MRLRRALPASSLPMMTPLTAWQKVGDYHSRNIGGRKSSNLAANGVHSEVLTEVRIYV
ncbi:exported hypothetical protein [Agrobacterium deltaense NCPPB 1641]|uniref:Uncharacterized protein n=1 Tax=Agrobacterium deltaense NCPPB 1641 TaxID=1183425 RepID=A0A1S7TN74_9HYPH|nr:exported hypothetical protein [Agrobacterium deltaense NCPPB 1641]